MSWLILEGVFGLGDRRCYRIGRFSYTTGCFIVFYAVCVLFLVKSSVFRFYARGQVNSSVV